MLYLTFSKSFNLIILLKNKRCANAIFISTRILFILKPSPHATFTDKLEFNYFCNASFYFFPLKKAVRCKDLRLIVMTDTRCCIKTNQIILFLF